MVVVKIMDPNKMGEREGGAMNRHLKVHVGYLVVLSSREEQR